uniref:Uncharacterized protein n=1 Tax=Arundo donax TaxID=35708 RepID=A0A0A9E9Q1_ARUDO
MMGQQFACQFLVGLPPGLSMWVRQWFSKPASR